MEEPSDGLLEAARGLLAELENSPPTAAIGALEAVHEHLHRALHSTGGAATAAERSPAATAAERSPAAGP